MFLALALLDKPEFNKFNLIKQLKEDWGFNFVLEDNGEDEAEKNIFYIEIENIRLGVSLVPMPVPNGECEQRARRNVQWDKAAEVAKNHKAHLIVTSMSEQKPADEAKLFVKLVSSVASLDNVIGLDVAGTILEPEFYANMAKRYDLVNALPLYNLIYFGMYSSDQDTISAYTLGMGGFKKPEMEIIASKHKLADVHELLFMVANHIIVNDIDLQNAKEIKLTEKDSVEVEFSQGIALNAPTVKIKY